jgi:hypothetical protein
LDDPSVDARREERAGENVKEALDSEMLNDGEKNTTAITLLLLHDCGGIDNEQQNGGS